MITLVSLAIVCFLSGPPFGPSIDVIICELLQDDCCVNNAGIRTNFFMADRVVALGTLDPADSSVSTHPNPIPPRTARGGTSLHFISKPRVPIPLQVQARPIPAPHHGRLLSVPFSADDPFSISFQSFRPCFCTSMFISLCMYVLNDVATLYKVSPVPLE